MKYYTDESYTMRTKLSFLSFGIMFSGLLNINGFELKKLSPDFHSFRTCMCILYLCCIDISSGSPPSCVT